jgi:hypothetical protein
MTTFLHNCPEWLRCPRNLREQNFHAESLRQNVQMNIANSSSNFIGVAVK